MMETLANFDVDGDLVAWEWCQTLLALQFRWTVVNLSVRAQIAAKKSRTFYRFSNLLDSENVSSSGFLYDMTFKCCGKEYELFSN